MFLPLPLLSIEEVVESLLSQLGEEWSELFDVVRVDRHLEEGGLWDGENHGGGEGDPHRKAKDMSLSSRGRQTPKLRLRKR